MWHYLKAFFRYKNKIVISISDEKNGQVDYIRTVRVNNSAIMIMVLRKMADDYEDQDRALNELENIIKR